MSLDEISVRIGVSDIQSLKDARDVMKEISALSSHVTRILADAENQTSKTGAKIKQVQAKAPELKGVIESFAKIFNGVFSQWQGLGGIAKEEIGKIRAEIGGVVTGLKTTSDALKTEFDKLSKSSSIKEISKKMSEIMQQSNAISSIDSRLGQLAGAQGKKGVGGADVDVKTLSSKITEAVVQSFSSAISDLNNKIKAAEQAAVGITSSATAAITSSESKFVDASMFLSKQLEKAKDFSEGKDKLMSTLSLSIKEFSDRIDAVYKAVKDVPDVLAGVKGATAQAGPAVQSKADAKRDRKEQRVFANLDNFTLDWRMYVDKFRSLFDKVDEIKDESGKTNRLVEKIDKYLHRRNKDKMVTKTTTSSDDDKENEIKKKEVAPGNQTEKAGDKDPKTISKAPHGIKPKQRRR